ERAATRLEVASETVAVCPDRVSSRAPRRAGGVMKIGFVGLGIMGHPMALNLIKGGHELFVYGKRRLPADVREAGATVCDTLTAIAENAEVVILMVPDPPDVKSVLFDPGGISDGLSLGQIVVD